MRINVTWMRRNGSLNKSNSDIKEIEEMTEMVDVQFNEANLLFPLYMVMFNAENFLLSIAKMTTVSFIFILFIQLNSDSLN